MDEKKFTDLRIKKVRELIDEKEIEKYFKKRGIDLEGGIERIKKMVDRCEKEIERKAAEG